MRVGGVVALGLLVAARGAQVFTRSVPLVGGPAWLKLHQCVIVVDDGCRLDVRASFGAEARAPVLFDFLPIAPTELETAASLALGRSVRGRVRRVDVPSSLLPIDDAVLRVQTYLSLEDMERWALDDYPSELALYGPMQNHCRTFVERFLGFVA
jgi:hypothetical protein